MIILDYAFNGYQQMSIFLVWMKRMLDLTYLLIFMPDQIIPMAIFSYLFGYGLGYFDFIFGSKYCPSIYALQSKENYNNFVFVRLLYFLISFCRKFRYRTIFRTIICILCAGFFSFFVLKITCKICSRNLFQQLKLISPLKIKSYVVFPKNRTIEQQT